MPKSNVPRVSKPTRLALHATRVVLGAAMGIAAALALPHLQAGGADCSLFQARIETSEYPALELHFCAMIPSAGGAAVVRYDIAVRVAIMPPAVRRTSSPLAR